MKKNGFTLVEMLAVIVVIALIGGIIIPKVINTINSSKQNSDKVSIELLVRALNNLAIDKKANLVSFNGCSIDFDDNINTCTDLEYTGILPTGGSIGVDSSGNVIGSVLSNNSMFEIRNNQVINLVNGYEYTFDYTGGEQVFSILTSGYYKLETWGAQGGNGRSVSPYGVGGYGGYSTGVIDLTSSDILYVNVGGRGFDNLNNSSCFGDPTGSCYGGYNGGGNSHYASSQAWGSGGGATHISLKSGLLSTLSNDIDKILIVSGGGGGAYSSWDGGSAGGYIGSDGHLRDGYVQSIGGTQLTGGSGVYTGSFGLGGFEQSGNGTGGGAGFYGAGCGRASSAGGGSGYIGNQDLINKHMTCYMCTEADGENDDDIRTISTTDVSESPLSDNAKMGNGFVKITYLGESID